MIFPSWTPKSGTRGVGREGEDDEGREEKRRRVFVSNTRQAGNGVDVLSGFRVIEKSSPREYQEKYSIFYDHLMASFQEKLDALHDELDSELVLAEEVGTKYFLIHSGLEGLASWRYCLYAAVDIATSLKRVLVEPCVRQGQLVPCSNSSYPLKYYYPTFVERENI
eukprot:CAMPEP_0174271536 /NCGR_PEP_ID=MMETSP0439-20130205/48225_1 /TAXON_ID=0 /ORGANISM="Stereomyxa ramosa, Strain Chinc5" /LENGTH=165 /DNA_ID=CAMNT_0015361599 /DNA_START=217 /DNA_END=711 /DNA_ORIENTATION=-